MAAHAGVQVVSTNETATERELSVQFSACAFTVEELLVSFYNLCLHCSNQLVQSL